MFRKKNYKQFLSGALALTMLLSFKSSFAFAKAPKTPNVPTPAVTAVKNTLTKYNINTKFDDASKIFTSTETVNFTNTYNEKLNSLAFHLYADSYGSVTTIPDLGMKKEKLENDEIGDITITNVTIDNKKMEFTQDKQILKIKPTTDINSNQSIIIQIDFTLKLPISQNRLGYYNNVYSVTNWYPIISIYDTKTDKWDENPFHPTGESNYSDIANYNVSINVPENMILASTGTTNSNKKGEKATKTYAITAENVRDFVFIMSPSFKVITKKCDDITVNSFYLEDGAKETSKRAEELLDLSIDSLKFFGDNFGKYPYKEFDTVETYVQGFAMEYPQLIQMGKYFPSYNNEIGFAEEATVHEVAHQWWYVTVGNNEFKDSFLDESLTAFSTAYYFEKKYGKYSSVGIAVSLRDKIDIYKGCSTPINVSVDQIKPKEFGKLIYKMGALVFENLRQKVGQEDFLKIIKTYYAKNTFKNATLDGLLSVIEEIGGKQAKEQVLSDVNSKDFNPSNLSLSNSESEELAKINEKNTRPQRDQIKQGLMSFKQENKNSFASFFIQALDNYNVYLIKPSNSKMSEETKKIFDNTINTLKMTLENGFALNVIIKEDTALTEQELKENSLIFIGNTTENASLKSIVDKFPIDLSKDEIKFDDVTFKNKDISGMLVADTSKNKNNNVLIILGLDKINDFTMLNGWDFYGKQFILYFGDKTLNGNYDTK
ncbi:M1 family metallopeptidase [Clostridium sp. CF012]|uniref:M1 family metallopeptidase n=1 Tax=Clostridium sp. CF012 TaxID=2843319 RepID=UPI001C0D20D8|nr:M1 family metallopeptidase [Clostridium sp. CF012]MBU3144026.1 M1 family metallopeptidase [Clostridium sp. CF012]